MTAETKKDEYKEVDLFESPVMRERVQKLGRKQER